MRRLTLDAVALGAQDRLASVDLAYETHGTLDPQGGNCIVVPTYYTGTDESYLPWIGPGRPFDTDRWFVVVPNLLGNGRSAVRDARTGRPWDPLVDPVIRLADNVTVQRTLLEHLGVQHVALVAGWSMGGMQAYEWAVRYPDLVDAILPVCAGARCWPLNAMFLQAVAPFLRQAAGAVTADVEGQWLAAFGRAYASWAFSAEYFRDELWRRDGFASLDGLLERWAADHVSLRPSDLLTMLCTWQSADRASGRLEEALADVRARAIVMPSTTDMYFTLAESALEVGWQRNAELRPLVSASGHVAGRPGYLPHVTEQIRRAAADLLG